MVKFFMFLPKTEVAVHMCSKKYLFRRVHRKTHMQESLFKKSGRPTSYKFILKHSPVQAFSYELCQIFHGTFFAEDLRATASTKYPFVR